MKILIIPLVLLLTGCENKTETVEHEPYNLPDAVHPRDSLLAKYSTTTPLLMLFDTSNRRVNLGTMCFADFPNPITNGLKYEGGFFSYSMEDILNEMRDSSLDTVLKLREYKCLYGFNPSTPAHLRGTLNKHLKQAESDFYKNFPNGIFIIINTEWNENSPLSYDEVIADRVQRREEGNYYSSTQ